MGATNVAKVFVNWPASGLTQRELLALVYMANISLDKDCPPVFFGDLQDMATAIGLSRGTANPESVRASVMKILSGLRKAGAIVSSGQARTGIRANYALSLDLETTFEPVGKGRSVQWKPVKRSLPWVANSATQNEAKPASSVAKSATQPVAESATQGVAKSATQPVANLATPRNTQGTPRNNWEENNRLLDASLEARNSKFDSVDDESEISIEQRYAAARDFLQTLKDNGAGLVATVEESNPDLSLTQRVIEAANLARQCKGNAA
ncbi:hypothetical protein [Glutamicibacter sp. 2E12]|uniref:hypothetical protein n=1 Tax=Glutamicibacter sp. 2E12 TaxID=3416181 RepID=UPI003CF2F733